MYNKNDKTYEKLALFGPWGGLKSSFKYSFNNYLKNGFLKLPILKSEGYNYFDNWTLI